jgi:hypothetical protein
MYLKMSDLVITHKRQLFFAITICLFVVLTISTGKIFVNLLDHRSKIDLEKQVWTQVSQSISSKYTLAQQKEWSNFTINNPTIFLQANSSKYFSENNTQTNPAIIKVVTNSFKNILANIAVTTRKDTTRVGQH